MPVEDESPREIQKISNDPLQPKPYKIRSYQGFGMEISQQVVGQIYQEDISLGVC